MMGDSNQTLANPADEANEYQYQPSEEAGDVDSSMYQDTNDEDLQQAAIQRFDRAKLKKILLPIVLVLVILLVYQILSWYSKSKEKARLAQQVTPTTAITPQPTKPVVTTPVQTPAPVMQQAPVRQSPAPQTTEALNKLHAQINQSAEQLSSVANTVNQNQMNIANLSNSMHNLAATVNSLNQNLNSYIKSQQRKKHKKLVLPKKISYHVKAIVPGRAWLESPRGKTVSVQLGDRINDGTVQLIAPTKGLVVTSTGEIFQYGSNDI